MSRSYHETLSLLKGKTATEIDDFLMREYEGMRLIEKKRIKRQIREERKENKEYSKRFPDE